MKNGNVYAEVKIGTLSHPSPGSFKIGPFGSALKKDELVHSGIPVVGIENVLPNRFVTSFRKFITDDKYGQLSQYAIEAGDILVTTMGTIGRAAVVPKDIGTAIIDSHLFRMRLNQSMVDPHYLCYAINGYSGLQQQLAQMSRGSIMAGLNTTILKECSIPLPPLAEQQRIAANLTEQMAAVDRARAAAEAQLAAAHKTPHAYLREVFQVSPAKKWTSVRLDDLCTIVRGSSPRPKGDKRYYGGIVPRLMVADVTRDGMYVTPQIDFLTEEGAKLSRPMSKGDVVMVVSGAPGLPAILDIDACIHDGFVGFRNLHECTVLNTYLYYFLSYIRNETDAQATGAIFRNLTTDQIGNIQVLMPPIAEQQRIADHLTDQGTIIQRVRWSLEEQLTAIKDLPAALLRRAFKGEL